MAIRLLKEIDSFIWENRLHERGFPGRVASTSLRYLYAILRDVFSGGLTMRAMSLVYTTLLSVVPLIAFSFSVLKGFGIHEQLEGQMYLLLEPLGEKGVEITDNIMRLVENVNGGVLGGVSLVFFIYTALSMVQKVEESFNYVWYVSKPRSFARRFTEYMFVMLVGPLAIAISLGMITSLQNDTFVQYLLANELVGPLFVATSKLTPYLLVIAVFTFLYAFIPNTKVKIPSAFIGGVSGGFMWASLSVIFTAFVVNAARTQAVYASFAIAITALIWIYLNWMVLLLGAQIAFYKQNPEYLRVGRQEPNLSNAVRERLALNIMFHIGESFRDKGSRITVDALSKLLQVPSLAFAPVINALEQNGLLTSNEDGHLLPGVEVSRMTLDEILEVVRQEGETGSLRAPKWSAEVDSVGKDLDMAVAKTLGTKTLSQLLDDSSR